LAAEGADWHTHPFDELVLVTDDACIIGHAPGWRDTAPNTLLHYRAGERHGAWISPLQHPRFWVVHFAVGPKFARTYDKIGNADPARRVWSLTPEQIETFRWLFLQMLNEHTRQRAHREMATRAWLQLLLVSVERWAGPAKDTATAIPASGNAGVLRLWRMVNEAVGKQSEELKEIYDAPDYDSVRHAFRKTFGCSPREMLQRLRMEHAKSLLLDTLLNIKEISARVGYTTQHDFNRMFHRYTGMAPSAWRSNPFERSKKKT
jgi:hypothetical protein